MATIPSELIRVKEILDATNISITDEIELYEYVAKLQDENEILKRDIEALQNNYNEMFNMCNSRIDKAIEYIEARTFDEVSIAPFIDDFDFKDNILNILRGEK